MSDGFGFEDLSDDGLASVRARYLEGLAEFERGEINYPCGVRPFRVRRWIAEVEAVMVKRGLTVPV